MKKLYTFALAGIIAMSASALEFSAPKTTISAPAVAAKMKVAQKDTNTLPSSLKKKAPARAAENAETSELASYAGEYTWTYYSMLVNDGEDLISKNVTISIVDEKDGSVEINGIIEDISIKATMDLEKKTFTVPNMQYLGKTSEGDLYFYFKELNEDETAILSGASSAKSVEAEIDGSSIIFPEYNFWAIGMPTVEDGYYLYAYYNELDEVDAWISVGKGSLTENILYNAYVGQPNTKAYETEILVAKRNSNLYQVTNAYLATMEALNANVKSTPSFYFNTEDPDNVIVPMSFAGIQDQEIGMVYILSESYFRELTNNPTVNNKATFTREGDKCTLNCPAMSLLFTGLSDPEYGLYYCSQTAATTLTFTQKADTNGIEDITVDDNAPVEYYNLQGIRVANPSNGVYIQRQGNKATKVRF